MYMARNSFLSGELPLEDYRKELIRIMESNDMDDFSSRGMFVNFTVPLEYILTLDRDNLTEEQEQTVRKAYEKLAVYAYRMPKTGVLSFMLTFIIIFLKNYIEVPGGMTFRGMCRQIMSAMHPPTYVHTVSVAAITKRLAEQLIKRQPELFLGIEDTKSVEEVALREEEVINFVYNAALLHDIGKLFIIETILTYGRNLLESEAGFIKVHTVVGASLLKRYPGTAEYADIALGHHRWYDDSQGYPDDFRINDSKYKTVISLVQAADCLDAATDTIGRSYKQGKSLDAVIEEIKAESGTRYAPYVAELLDEPEVRDELERLLTIGRDENYRGAYYLLKALRSND
jgi:HD-GYP domain-containing protein (c-di-GMP phosphodiesterase class II)